MKLYAAVNLTKKTVFEYLPWEYEMGEVSDAIRNVKSARQGWYRNPTTQHNFYSGFEGVNPNARIGADNPAHGCRALIADVDHKYTEAEIKAIISQLPFLPTWLEHSLGGGWRLLWVFEDKLRWPNCSKLSEALLADLLHLLSMDKVVGLDKSSWGRTSQLYANGGVWENLGGQPIQLSLLESTVFNSAVKVAKQVKHPDVILPRIEEMIKKKWPEWTWPEDFTDGSQGPSWWIEGSTSTKSAIVHGFGMYTFADHANGKTLWTWDDLLGAGAVEQDRQAVISQAVEHYYTDNKQYYRPKNDGEGGFEELNPQAMRRALTCVHGLSSKTTKKNPNSEVEMALTHIETTRRVDNVAPFIYRKPGIIYHNGLRFLNPLDLKPMPPAPEASVWGPDGKFPFLSDWLDRVFVHPDQLEHFLLWWHWAYKNAVDGTPEQGQGAIIMGGTNTGKTFLSNKCIGPSLGGGESAIRYLMNEDSFGGHLFHKGFWAVDDQSMTSSIVQLRKFTGVLKRSVADREHEYHMKFCKPCRLLWMGRILVTCNIDMYSKMVMPSLEESIRDKLNFYRWINNKPDSPEHDRLPPNYFPRSAELQATVDRELPYLLRYIYDLEIPDRWVGDSRYGIQSFQDSEMISASFVNSGASAAHELITQFMEYHISLNESTLFEGTTTRLLTAINEIPTLVPAARGMTIDGLTRRLGQMSDANKKLIDSYYDDFGERIWVIDWSKRTKRKSL